MRFVDTNILLYAIIEAARSQGCAIVLSEDLQHGQDFGGAGGESVRLNGRSRPRCAVEGYANRANASAGVRVVTDRGARLRCSLSRVMRSAPTMCASAT